MLLTIAFRNIRRNGRRTGLCVAASGVAVFFIIFMQSMIAGMTAGIDTVVQVFDTGHVTLTSADYEAEKESLPVWYPAADGRPFAEIAAAIRKIPHVKAVLPRIMAFATLQDSTQKHALLWGISLQDELAAHDFNLTARSDGLTAGRFPGAEAQECAIGTAMARKTGLGIGDRIPLKTVSAQFSDKMWNPVITGIFEFDYLKYDAEVILVPIDRLQRLLVLGDAAQQVVVFADRPSDAETVAAAMRDLFGAGNIVEKWQDNYFVALMRAYMPLYTLVYLVFVVVASFLIINTVLMIIHERMKEIGMMGSLGMTRREIVLVFFYEAVFLAGLGSLAGCAAGGLSTFALSFFPIDFAAMSGGGFKEMPMSGTLFMVFSPLMILQGFFFGLTVTGLCTLIPSLRCAFIPPVDALR
ncbi:MAG: FtsX-like permease family protein [Spirochaetaceae bacterium]|nr:FtsX-like permease family protein [Spirochaetaceae bacterium]